MDAEPVISTTTTIEDKKPADIIATSPQTNTIVETKPIKIDHNTRKIRSYLITYDNASHAIFKPSANQPDIGYPRSWDPDHIITGESQAKREESAFLISESLELDFVPPTTTQTIDSQTGSIQQWIPNAETSETEIDGIPTAVNIFEWPVTQNDWIDATAFLYIIGQVDGHQSNIIRDPKTGKIKLVDNGLSMARGINPKEFCNNGDLIFKFQNQPLTENFLNKLKSILSNEGLTPKGEQLKTKLLTLNQLEEVDDFFSRIRHILNTQAIPPRF